MRVGNRGLALLFKHSRVGLILMAVCETRPLGGGSWTRDQDLRAAGHQHAAHLFSQIVYCLFTQLGILCY